MSKGIVIKTDEEIEFLRESNLMVSKTLALMGELLKPGIKTNYLDKIAEEYIHDNGGIPSFKGYSGFPASLCISINEAVVHGIPSDREIIEGDVVSIDCGVYKNGFHGDSAYTFAVGDVEEEIMNLLRATNESLYLGIEKAVVGNRLGDIGFAVQDYTEKQRPYGVVREMVGHGVGRNLHESPEVPNYGRRGKGMMLKENMTIAIEPMITLGKRSIKVLKDNWTIVTRDGKPAAHYEHSIAVKKHKADVLSDHSIIEEVIKKNINIKKLK
ncbi:MAG TPA: type I methionyl aminopeptidase [Bacteroidetes bacterium]|nr:type I methionyl aminopeptidase [Bacteroidota bacterium]